jgi:hypothetical protein
VLITSHRKIRQLGGHHGALALVEVTTPHVFGQHEAQRVVSYIFDERRLDSGHAARQIAAAPIQNLSIQGRDGLKQTTMLDVVGKSLKLFVVGKSENVGELVEWYLCGLGDLLLFLD